MFPQLPESTVGVSRWGQIVPGCIKEEGRDPAVTRCNKKHSDPRDSAGLVLYIRPFFHCFPPHMTLNHYVVT